MPYKSMEDAPASWKKLEDVTLSLEQVNWIANVYDALKSKEEKGEIESAAAIAIQRFKDTHKIENDKWVKAKKESDDLQEAKEEYLDPEKKKYPCDKKNLMDTMKKFNKPGMMTEDGYSKSEWRKMGKMLSEKMGDEYEFDSDKMMVMKKETHKKESIVFKESSGQFLESDDPEGKEWDVALITAGKSSNEGTHGLTRYYSEEALKDAVEKGAFSKGPVKLYQFGKTGALFDHVPANVLESHPDGVFGNQVGWIDNERYGEFTDADGQKKNGVLGRFHIMEGFEWLRKALKDMWENGKTMLGFSIDGEGDENPRFVNGEAVDYVDVLNHISENTLVSNPAAGGGLLRMVASANNNNHGDTEMNLVEIFKLIKELKPKLLEGKEEAKLTESDALEMLREAMKTEQPNLQPAAAPVAILSPATPAIDPKTVEQIQAVVAQLTESIKLSAKNQALTTRMTESNLPTEFKNDLSRRYLNKDWKEEDLNADIKAEQDKAAKMRESHPVYGQTIQIGSGEKEKFQLAMDGFFENKNLKDKDGKFVPRFVSFKEAYSNIVGDPRAAYASATTIIADSYFYQPDNLSADTARLTESYDRERRKKMRESMLREGMQTSDWGQILGDSVTRRMQKEAENPQLNLWRKIVSDIVPVNDFRTQRRMKMGGYGILSTVAERGTYQSLTSPTDDEATYAATKKGGTEDLTLEMIANDDVGSIRRLPVKMGRAATQTIYRDIFDMFKNNLEQDGSTTLASSARANYITTVLSTVAYGELRYTMRSLTKYGDTYEELGYANIPKILIVPNELEDIALRVKNSDVAVSNIFTAGTSHYNTQTEPNNYKQDITDVIVVDYWTDATDWWGVADPAVAPTIEVGFYQGRETPELFVQDQPNVGSVFTADKITYKIRYIYGFAILEYRSFGLSHQ